MLPADDVSSAIQPIPIRVLVIDDHRTMRQSIRGLLGQVGITDVEEAENGEAALSLLHRPGFKYPDVIICDLHMKKGDGMEFCNATRRDERLRDRRIPILILTGDKDDLVHDVAAQVGAAAILTKPISAGELRRQIEMAVGYSVGK